ncbi:MAG TPA: T9SS type A sorting domain-containing protein, partial [Bacteroidia bacterium]
YRINNTNSVNEPSINDLVVIYPNPSEGIFQIMNNDLRILNIKIFNVVGECIYQNSSVVGHSNPSIDLSDRPNGIYFINMCTDKGNAVKKIILNK